MTANLLLLPSAVVGAFVLLLATTWLERLVASADPTFPSRPVPAGRTTRKKEAQWASS